MRAPRESYRRFIQKKKENEQLDIAKRVYRHNRTLRDDYEAIFGPDALSKFVDLRSEYNHLIDVFSGQWLSRNLLQLNEQARRLIGRIQAQNLELRVAIQNYRDANPTAPRMPRAYAAPRGSNPGEDPDDDAPGVARPSPFMVQSHRRREGAQRMPGAYMSPWGANPGEEPPRAAGVQSRKRARTGVGGVRGNRMRFNVQGPRRTSRGREAAQTKDQFEHLKETRDRNSVLTSENKRARKEIEELKTEARDLRKKKADAELTAQIYATQKTKLRKKNEAAERRAQLLTVQRAELRRELRAAARARQKQQQQSDALQAEVGRLVEVVNVLQAELQKARAELQEARAGIALRDTTIAHAREEIAAMDAIIKRRDSQHDPETDLDRLEVENEQLRTQVLALQKELQGARSGRQVDQLRNLQEKMQRLQAELARARALRRGRRSRERKGPGNERESM